LPNFSYIYSNLFQKNCYKRITLFIGTFSETIIINHGKLFSIYDDIILSYIIDCISYIYCCVRGEESSLNWVLHAYSREI